MVMPNKKESIKSELKELIKCGRYLLYNEAINKSKLDKKQIDFITELEGFKEFQNANPFTHVLYQKWYSKSILVIKQILPDRLEEFRKLYILEKRDIKNITFLTYTISDYFLGLSITRGWEEKQVVDQFATFYSKMGQQVEILNSCTNTDGIFNRFVTVFANRARHVSGELSLGRETEAI
jgi:hypothetical protein